MATTAKPKEGHSSGKEKKKLITSSSNLNPNTTTTQTQRPSTSAKWPSPTSSINHPHKSPSSSSSPSSTSSSKPVPNYLKPTVSSSSHIEPLHTPKKHAPHEEHSASKPVLAGRLSFDQPATGLRLDQGFSSPRASERRTTMATLGRSSSLMMTATTVSSPKPGLKVITRYSGEPKPMLGRSHSLKKAEKEEVMDNASDLTMGGKCVDKNDESSVETKKEEEPRVEAKKDEKESGVEAKAKEQEEEPRVEAKEEEEPRVEAKEEEDPRSETKKEEEPRVEAKKEEAPKVEAKEEEEPRDEAKEEEEPISESKKEEEPSGENKKEERESLVHGVESEMPAPTEATKSDSNNEQTADEVTKKDAEYGSEEKEVEKLETSSEIPVVSGDHVKETSQIAKQGVQEELKTAHEEEVKAANEEESQNPKGEATEVDSKVEPDEVSATDQAKVEVAASEEDKPEEIAKVDDECDKKESEISEKKEEKVEHEQKQESRMNEGQQQQRQEKPRVQEEEKKNVVAPLIRHGGGGGKGKKEASVYNDVIEETANKLLEKRKNKVMALAGAFQSVIDNESSSRFKC